MGTIDLNGSANRRNSRGLVRGPSSIRQIKECSLHVLGFLHVMQEARLFRVGFSRMSIQVQCNCERSTPLVLVVADANPQTPGRCYLRP